jgi:hypothetical protein
VTAALFVIQLVLCIAAALTAGWSAQRRILAGILVTLALALPFFADGPLPRGVFTYIALLCVMKVVQIATSKPSEWTVGRRIWTALVPFDVRRTRRTSPALDRGLSIRAVGFAVLAGAVFWFGSTYSGPWNQLVAWSTIVAFLYALMEAIVGGIRLFHALAGIHVDPIQKDPIKARSVAEFWSERWNLPVTHWLHEAFFHPLAKRGHPQAGVMAAFGISALFHGWLLFLAVDWRMGLMAAGFFVLQLPAIAVERRWRVRKWSAAAAHAWTLLFLLAASPLLTVPLLRGLELQIAISK